MDDRTQVRKQYLAASPWAHHRCDFLAGDASNRKYWRLNDKKTGGTVVLMDAPGDPNDALLPFVDRTNYLEQIGLAPPKIFAQNTGDGFLVIEDLGDRIFARFLETDPTAETALYTAAVDVLIHLYHAPRPAGVGTYDPELMADLGDLARSWYSFGCDGPTDQPFKAELESVLSGTWSEKMVFVQRDYHAENLLWNPDEKAPKNVGLLDYQDGLLGHPAYDLVSLLEDARRDVSPTIKETMLDHYISKTDQDPATFKAAFASQGAQRNLRILGVFARLSMHYGKPHYVDLIPRVWDHLQNDLSHPSLTKLRKICDDTLPPPTPKNLQKLRDKCATIPHP
ncbi:aminoglycoside phosphotransferase family protein [Algirhabdus cladophorae]|uniref:aminoglycoside phosphotransferase family protein n=1 Tax=Algirhabdus cladophorae TaxID=3377108 RepID=UPI003B847284